jgi:hypothetical protein
MESVCLNSGDDVVEGAVWVPKPYPEEFRRTLLDLVARAARSPGNSA